MPDETRHNPFHLLNKALRFGQCRMLTELGAQDLRNDEACARLLGRLVEQLELFRAAAVARHESLCAALAEHGEELPAATGQDHASHLTALAELDSLVRAVRVAAPQRRRLAARSIYRCFSLYTAAEMTRMDEDETVLLTTLHQLLDDQALLEVETLCLAALTPEHLPPLLRLMTPALSSAELADLLDIFERAIDPGAFATTVEPTIRPMLAGDSFAAA